MKKILCEENIFLNLNSITKEEAIKMAGEKLFENGYVNQPYIGAMLKREEIMTTYMGMGFAIPHGTRDVKDEINHTGIVILQFPNGVDFDGEKAYIVMGLAGLGDEHLNILSGISILIDDDLTEKLKNEKSKKVFLEVFGN